MARSTSGHPDGRQVAGSTSGVRNIKSTDGPQSLPPSALTSSISSRVQQEPSAMAEKRSYTIQPWLDENSREGPRSGVAGLRDSSDAAVESEYATSKGKAQEEIELLLDGRDGILLSLKAELRRPIYDLDRQQKKE